MKTGQTDIDATRDNITDLRLYMRPLKNPTLVELLDHWERLRGRRIAPQRSEIDPRQIENVLQHAFILERVTDGEARFRIAGMDLCALMGMEVRAMPATSIIHPDDRAVFSGILEKLFTTPEVIELTLEAAIAGRPALGADMLLLPMTNETGEITRVLGCLVATGTPTDTPHRFAIKARKATRIIASDYQPARPQTMGFAEAPQRFTPRPAHSRGPSHLTLVAKED